MMYLALLALLPLTARSETHCGEKPELRPAFQAALIQKECGLSWKTCVIPQTNQVKSSRVLQEQVKISCETIRKFEDALAQTTTQSRSEADARRLQESAKSETKKLIDLLQTTFIRTRKDLDPVIRSLVDSPEKSAFLAASFSPERARKSGILGAPSLNAPGIGGNENLFAARNGTGFLRAVALELQQRESDLVQLGGLSARTGKNLLNLKRAEGAGNGIFDGSGPGESGISGSADSENRSWQESGLSGARELPTENGGAEAEKDRLPAGIPAGGSAKPMSKTVLAENGQGRFPGRSRAGGVSAGKGGGLFSGELSVPVSLKKGDGGKESRGLPETVSSLLRFRKNSGLLDGASEMNPEEAGEKRSPSEEDQISLFRRVSERYRHLEGDLRIMDSTTLH